MNTETPGPPSAHILIVDDERAALKKLRHVLVKEGYQVSGAGSGPAGLRALEKERFDLVLTELRMEKVDGMQILKYCRERYTDTAVVMITGFATVSSAVNAMREGAFHYIAKPFGVDEVRRVVREALALTALRRENQQLRKLVAATGEEHRFLTQDPATQRVLDTAHRIAPSTANVIITGESGTGKELMAHFIHEHSQRKDKPFVAVNCGAFSEELLVNELFGHEKGAYTGASEARPGLIESADQGTLFLDEVTEMSPAMQVKLLRVIQEGELRRLGGTRPIKVNVRYLSATNRDLQETVANGSFRQDLYYRLNVVHLDLPPLNERAGDVPLLAHYFLKRHAAQLGKKVEDIDPEAMALLNEYDFPGNVRELANLIERGIALANGETLRADHLPPDLQQLKVRAFRYKATALPTLEEQETAYIKWVLEQTGGNRTRAADILGIDRVSLWRKINKYGL